MTKIHVPFSGLYSHIVVETLQASFEVWCVLHDTSDGTIIPLKQTTWSLDIDSTKPNQHALGADSDADPTDSPILQGPQANSVDPVVQPDFTNTITFTK
jgi:hypothetical protein